LKINERKELKEIAKNLAKISQSSDFFLNRNDVVTSTDKEHIKILVILWQSVRNDCLKNHRQD